MFILYVLLCNTALVQAQTQKKVLSVPGKAEYTHIDKNGVSVLPSGRYLTPAGKTITVSHDPFGMAVSPDGSKTVTLHDGVFTVIDNETKLLSGIYNASAITGKFILVLNPYKSYKAIVEEEGCHTMILELEPLANDKEDNDLILSLTKKK